MLKVKEWAVAVDERGPKLLKTYLKAALTIES
jgi:hypothetical protein